jgi:hypothetical protein
LENAGVATAVVGLVGGVLGQGVGNQIARLTSRTRELVHEWRELEEGNARRELLRAQVSLLERRHLLLARSLTLAYGGLVTFGVAALLGVAQARSEQLPAWLVGVPLAFGVALLGNAAVHELMSLRVGREALGLEKREMFMESDLPAPTGERRR